MAEPTKRKKWSDVKAPLEAFDRKGFVSLIGELYGASVANRRFLHSRLTPSTRAIEECRQLVADAIYPDPFSKRRVSVRDAAAAIVEYRRSTGDAAGTVDLMLTLVEAGTEQAADPGYGDEAYFNALQIRLDAVVEGVRQLARGCTRASESASGSHPDAWTSAGASAMLWMT